MTEEREYPIGTLIDCGAMGIVIITEYKTGLHPKLVKLFIVEDSVYIEKYAHALNLWITNKHAEVLT